MTEPDDDLVNWDLEPEATPPSEQPKSLTEDVIWSGVGASSDDESDFELQPLDAVVERNRSARRESYLTVGVVYEGEDEVPPRYQFSLRDLIILNVAIAIALAVMRIVAPAWTAGVLGAATLAAAMVLVYFQPDDRRIEKAWWALLVTYLIACVAAMVMGSW